jgi:hypothetical protein
MPGVLSIANGRRAVGQILENGYSRSNNINRGVAISVVAGQMYYVRAAATALGSPVGNYTISFHSIPVSPPTVQPISFAYDLSAYYTGSIDVPGEANTYSFVAPATGEMTIAQSSVPLPPPFPDPTATELDSLLTVFDGNHVQIAENDDSVPGFDLNSFVRINVVSGQTYYVRAGGANGSTGMYNLSLNLRAAQGAGDLGHTFAQAAPINLDPFGSGSQAATIPANDQDVFRFVAPITGRLMILPRLGDYPFLVYGSLSVYDNSQQILGSSSFGFGSHSASGGFTLFANPVGVQVVAGQPYYIQVTAPSGVVDLPPAPFSLTIGPDDLGDPFANPKTIALNPSGPVTQTGDIEVGGGEDVYRFVPPVTGRLAIDISSTGLSLQETSVSVFDAAQRLSTTDRPPKSFPDAPHLPLSFEVVAGQVYYVQVATSPAATDNLGTYSLHLTVLPPAGASFSNADLIPLTGTNTLGFPGAQGQLLQIFTEQGDVDTYQFVAPVTGSITVIMQGGQVGSLLSVYDSAQHFITSNRVTKASNGVGEIRGMEAGVAFQAIAGHTYYLQASTSQFASSATYPLAYSLSVDDESRRFEFDPAAPVFGEFPVQTLSSTDSGSVTGTIDVPSEAPVIPVEVPMSGTVVVTEDPNSTSNALLSLVSTGPNGSQLLNTPATEFQFQATGDTTYSLMVIGEVGEFELSFLGVFPTNPPEVVPTSPPSFTEGTTPPSGGGTTGGQSQLNSLLLAGLNHPPNKSDSSGLEGERPRPVPTLVAFNGSIVPTVATLLITDSGDGTISPTPTSPAGSSWLQFITGLDDPWRDDYPAEEMELIPETPTGDNAKPELGSSLPPTTEAPSSTTDDHNGLILAVTELPGMSSVAIDYILSTGWPSQVRTRHAVDLLLLSKCHHDGDCLKRLCLAPPPVVESMAQVQGPNKAIVLAGIVFTVRLSSKKRIHDKEARVSWLGRAIAPKWAH